MIKNIIHIITNTKFLFIFLMLINLGVILYHFSEKQGFHSDEQWSYAHANSSQGAYLDKEIDSYYKINDNIRKRLFYKYIDSSILKEYLTVEPKEAFLYNNIYNNLKIVEHPPLYYIILHTVSSFFPENFNKWQAGSINLVIFILIYIMLFKLSKLILKDDKLALCATVLWGFSEIGIDTIIFLRMYVLQTLLCVCLMYETLKILDKNNATKKELFLVFLYSFLGIFTQYNSIFFSFFVALVACFYLLKNKNYKLMLIYGIIMLLSVLMLFAIFPQSYEVLFNSLRAKQVVSNTMLDYTDSSSNAILEVLYKFDKRLGNIFGVLTQNFMSFNTTNHKFIMFTIIIGTFIAFYLKLKISSTTSNLILITLLYFLYLLNMPYMRIFHSRYYMCIMPFIAILFIVLLTNILTYLKISAKYRLIIVISLLVINFISMDFRKNSAYSFLWSKEEALIYNKIKDKEVFIDSGNMFIWLHSMVYYLANAQKVYIAENICEDVVLNAITKAKQPIVLTYSSYIPKRKGISYNRCLESIGLKYKATVCPSQHCYDVWGIW